MLCEDVASTVLISTGLNVIVLSTHVLNTINKCDPKYPSCGATCALLYRLFENVYLSLYVGTFLPARDALCECTRSWERESQNCATGSKSKDSTLNINVPTALVVGAGCTGSIICTCSHVVRRTATICKVEYTQQSATGSWYPRLASQLVEEWYRKGRAYFQDRMQCMQERCTSIAQQGQLVSQGGFCENGSNVPVEMFNWIFSFGGAAGL
jgi:hypothetical protein